MPACPPSPGGDPQAREERLDQAVVPAARQRPGLGLKMLAAQQNAPLQFDELVQRELNDILAGREPALGHGLIHYD